MYRSGLLFLVFVISFSCIAFGGEVPLKDVWAFDMPGTKDIRTLGSTEDLDASKEPATPAPVQRMLKVLGPQKCAKEGEQIGAMFVVEGSGLEALERAEEVLRGKSKPEKAITEGEGATLVFYACHGRTPRLNAVEQNGNEIVVKYHIHAHRLSMSTPHFALIPLKGLSRGKVNVKIERLEDTGPNEISDRLNKQPVDRFISGPFSFEVIEQ